MNKNDLKFEYFRSTGNGGQNVNRRETAVRVTHTPTGIVATSQDERSQRQNKKRALATLQERLDKHEEEAYNRRINDLRRAQVEGMRIRTYNYQTDIDHRSGRCAKVKDVLNGALELMR